MRFFFLFGLCCILFVSCGKENPCSEAETLEKATLSPEAIAFNPYNVEDSKVYFTDTLGQEIVFDIERNFIQEGSNFTTGTCDLDPNEMAFFQYETEFSRLYLRNDLNGIYFHIEIADVVLPNALGLVGEVMRIYLSKVADANGALNLGSLLMEHPINVLDESGNPALTDRTEELAQFDILNTSFSNVLVNRWDVLVNDSDYEVYYQVGTGIVGFRNIVENRTFAFDRIE